MPFYKRLIIFVCLFIAKPAAASADEHVKNLIEPLFSIFRSDLTAIGIAGGMLLAAFLILMDFRQRVYNPLKRDIDQANHAFFGASDPETFSQIYDDVDQALNDSRFLSPIWLEFRETMSRADTNDGTVVWQNTKRPQDYFTADAILRQRGSMNSLDFWPNTFVGIGLLVTFLGLTVAVSDTASAIKAASEDMRGVLTSLENLLTIASIKFVTSVAGIACSIGMTISIKSMQSNIRQNLDRLHDRIERCLEFLSLERLQLRTIEAIEGISSSISSGVAEGVKSVAGNELRSFAEEMRLISDTLSNSKDDLRDFGKVYSQQLEVVDAVLTDRINKSSEAFNDWLAELQTDLRESSAAVKGQLKNFKDELSGIVRLTNQNAANANQELQSTMAEVTEVFKITTEGLAEKAAEQAEFYQRYLSGVEQIVKALKNNSEEFTAATERAISVVNVEHENTSATIETFKEEINSLRSAISEQSEKLGNLIDDASNGRASFISELAEREKEIATVVGDVARLVEKLSQSLNAVETNMDKSIQPLHNNISQLIKKIDEVGGNQQNNLISKLFRG